jgi:hypothetical protein
MNNFRRNFHSGEALPWVWEVSMRAVFLLAGALLISAPTQIAASTIEQKVRPEPGVHPVEDRWQGRRDILHDSFDNVETTGQGPSTKEGCRTIIVRYKRSDGTTSVRRENRCN